MPLSLALELQLKMHRITPWSHVMLDALTTLSRSSPHSLSRWSLSPRPMRLNSFTLHSPRLLFLLSLTHTQNHQTSLGADGGNSSRRAMQRFSVHHHPPNPIQKRFLPVLYLPVMTTSDVPEPLGRAMLLRLSLQKMIASMMSEMHFAAFVHCIALWNDFLAWM